MILETFRQAIRNVWSNKLRTFLTMLGIIIGVMAVIVIVGLGNGMTQSVRDSFASMGTNTLNISVYKSGSRWVSVDDMYKIFEKHSDLLSNVSPQVDFTGTVKIGTKKYQYTTVMGVNEEYTQMKNFTVAKGRGLQYMDIEDNKQVCVIGDYLNRVAFGGNGVGKTLKIGANKFRIVGVLSAKVKNLVMQEGSEDDCIYLPYTTATRLTRSSATSGSYLGILVDENYANDAKAMLETELYDILKSDNYYIYSASTWLEEANKMVNMIILVLAGIAALSLLVGGIGIMNIMLVSVTERTREIGIRKAMGAKERTILGQFVVEAGITSAFGGVVGIVMGYFISQLANQFILPSIASSADIGNITVIPSFNSVAIAFGVSVGIGVLFGYLPALRAARLNPIEALRYD